MINYDDFTKVEIRIGEIKKAEKIEKSNKLFLLQVDFGEDELRTVVSGIAPYFSDPDEVVNIQCAFVTNLEPRSIMGYESQAMILGVRNEDEFALLKNSKEVQTGSIVG